MIRRVLLLLLPALLGVTMASAKTFELNEKIPADPAVRIGTLENGLKYYIRHNEKPEQQADFYIYHNVGAIQEEDHQQGLAHFLEHMAFNGTKNLPGKMMIEYLETVGVKFGLNLNAQTAQDYTCYMIKSVPTTREGIVDTALLILHDWSHFISLEDEEIDNERGVIIEERRQGLTGARRIQEKIANVMYNHTKYADRNIIGHEERLRTFPYSDIKEFYNTWYRPDLQTIVIVGDINVDQVENKLIELMKDVPARVNPEPKVMYGNPGNKEPLVGIGTDPEMNGTNVALMINHDRVAYDDKDRVASWKRDNAVNLIGKMANSRLREIQQQVDAPYLSASISPLYKVNAVSDVFTISAGTRNGEALRGFEAAYTEVERMRRFGFTNSELEVAKAQRLRETERSYDSREDRRSGDFVWGYINNYTDNSPIPTAELAWELNSFTLATIDLEYVNNLIAELTKQEDQVVILMGPEQEGVFTPTEQDFLNVIANVNAAELQPMADEGGFEPLIQNELKGGKVKKTQSGAFGSTVWTLNNGAKVVVLPTDHKTDEVLFRIVAPGGLSLLPDEDIRSATVLRGVIEASGVDRFNANELRKQLAGKSVNIRPNMDFYTNGFAGSASSKDMETLLQLTYLYFTSPTISEDAYTVYMDGMRNTLRNSANDPASIRRDTTEKIVYGDDPRAHYLSIRNVDEVKFEKMMPIYQKMYGNADDFVYIFTGDIDLNTLKPLVEKYIGSLETTKSGRDFIDDGMRVVNGQVKAKIYADMQVPKSTVNYKFNGEIDYNLENSIKFSMLRQILVIRYMAVIREEKGGTYGVGVSAGIYNNPIQRYEVDVIFDTEPSRVDELAPIVVDELRNVAKVGPEEEDLSKIKEFMLKERMANLKTNATWRSNLIGYYLNGVDMTTGYEDIVNSITTEDIKALANKVVSDNNAILIVMDPK